MEETKLNSNLGRGTSAWNASHQSGEWEYHLVHAEMFEIARFFDFWFKIISKLVKNWITKLFCQPRIYPTPLRNPGWDTALVNVRLNPNYFYIFIDSDFFDNFHVYQKFISNSSCFHYRLTFFPILTVDWQLKTKLKSFVDVGPSEKVPIYIYVQNNQPDQSARVINFPVFLKQHVKTFIRVFPEQPT